MSKKKKSETQEPKLQDFKGKTIKDLWVEPTSGILNIHFTDETYLDIDVGYDGIKTTRKEVVTREEAVEYTLYGG